MLGFDPVPKQTVFNVLRRIGRKPITYDNVFLMKNRELLSESQEKYAVDIIIKRDTSNPGMSRKEVKQVRSELCRARSFVQAENHLEYLIRAKAADTFEKVLGARFQLGQRLQNDHRFVRHNSIVVI